MNSGILVLKSRRLILWLSGKVSIKNSKVMFILLQESLHGTVINEIMKLNPETVSIMVNIAHFNSETQDIMEKTLFMKI